MRSNGLLIVALVVFAAGGARFIPSLVTGPAAQPPSSSTTQSSNSASIAPPTPHDSAHPDALSLLADYLDVNVSSTTDPLATLKERARDKADVTFLTVTVPDAVDSYVKWEFDNMVQAVQFAAGRLGFVLDRFYLPDWDPLTDLENGRTLGRLHEQYPGVILFRRDSRASGTTAGKSEVLVTFLVAETPTSGVHKVALLQALRLAHSWDSSKPLKLVAPVYSGSRESIRTVFADLRSELTAPQGTEPQFQLVSGGATRSDNKDFFKASPGVTFTAAVHPDDQLEQALKEFVAQRIPRLRGASRIALFRESNTGWGASATEAEFRWDADTQVLDIPFPLHISRLPSAADPRRQSATIGQSFLPLPLTGERGATDQLPVTAPETTLPSMEIVMAQLLNTIKRERVAVAGLLATDARDRLFLAQQLSTKAPDLTLFTLESDLLYAHPTYGSDLRGMLTVSTYPLFSATQLWADPRGKNVTRLQFRSTSAQGIYNAVLMQLDQKAGSVDLLDYRDPFNHNSARPPVWISVVGRSGVWPLGRLEVPDDNGYLATVDRPQSDDDRQTIQLIRPTVPFAVGALAALAWICALPLTFLSVPATRWILKTGGARSRLLTAPILWLAHVAPHGSPFRHCDFSVTHGRRRYLIALFGAGALLAIVMTAAAWAWLGVERQAGWATHILVVSLIATSAAALILNVVAMVHAADKSWLANRRTAARTLVAKTRANKSVVVYRVFVGGAALIAFGATIAYAHSIATLESPDATLWLTRMVQPSNGVSPAMPIILLATTVTLWAALNLKRHGMPRRTRVSERLQFVDELLQFEEGASESVPASKIRHAVPTVVSVGTVSSAIAIVLVTGIPLSVEGKSFDFLYISASTLAYTFVSSALIQTVWLWRELTGVLATLRWHPLRKVFKRLPASMFSSRISTRAPQLKDLEPLVATYALSVAAPTAPVPVPVTQNGPAGDRSMTADEVWTRFRKELGRNPHIAWTDSETWKAPGGLYERSRSTVLSLRRAWQMEASSPEIAKQEDLVAMAIGLSLREILARLTNAVLFSTIALFLLLASHTLFPFGSRQALLATSWVYIISTIVVSFTIFSEIDRNEVISSITQTKAGQLNWDSTMLSRIVVYGVVPIASLIAAQFPQFSGVLSQWIVPMQRMLP
ncbi:MAG TPA: hypothetical protein VFU28_20570 [Vicinamibacterales bacterium]|nr:hypothetical protein [Vicinamibacterales bacterium]